MAKRSAHRACDDFRQTASGRRRHFAERPLTRRQVIAGGLGGGLSVYAAKAMPLARILEAAEAQAAAEPSPRVLVSVFLPGGCDLLDTLVPVGQYGRYADLRGGARVAAPLDLPGTGLGLHPALGTGSNGGVRGLYAAGKVGFLPGIDYANPDLSHFHSRHFWETGLITEEDAPGWLGRWLDRHGSPDNPLQGLSAGYTLSPALRTAGAPVAAVANPGDAQFWFRDVWGEPEKAAVAAWRAISARRPAAPGRAAAWRGARLAQQVGERLAPFAERDGKDPLAPPVPYPGDNEFAERLGRLAALIAQPLGVRVATVDADGDFDTHDNQPAELARSLGAVSAALAAFQADLGARGVADRVLTIVWSEFGRRPEANQSAGTDHGAGGVAWVQGTQAASGVLTDYPSLTALDREENLAVTVDFRRIYASLLEGWLGTPADEVIPRAGAFGRLALSR